MQRTTPILALASTKGGVGKTTLAFCIATTFARKLAGSSVSRHADIPVACVDADPNQTLLQAIRRGRPEGVSVDTATDDTILPALTEAAKKAALVVVDLAGSTNQAMLYAVGKANLVLIPAQPSSFDIVEALKTHAVIDKASDLTGRRILYRVVLTRVPVLRQRVVDHSRRQFQERGLELLKVELMERAAFRLMTFTGRPPAEEDPEGGAAQNVAALADELAAQLGMVDA